MDAADHFWQSCLSYFKRELPPQQFATWISPLAFHLDDDKAVLTAPIIAIRYAAGIIIWNTHLVTIPWQARRAHKPGSLPEFEKGLKTIAPAPESTSPPPSDASPAASAK